MPLDIDLLMGSARIDLVGDDTYFGEIDGLTGVWAMGETADRCREELQSVLIDWLEAKAEAGEDTPVLMLPASEDAVIPGPVLERILANLGISAEEWDMMTSLEEGPQ